MHMEYASSISAEARQTDLKSKNGRYKNGEQYRYLIGLLHTQTAY